MCAVTVLGTRTPTSASAASSPPDAPVSATTRSPATRARSAARITFAELPLVEMAISTSPVAAERLDLALEHALGAEVVRDGGEERRVGRERDRRDRRAGVVDRERADELRREVLRVGRAAAVAADQELAPASQRGRRGAWRPTRRRPGTPPRRRGRCPRSREVAARRSPSSPRNGASSADPRWPCGVQTSSSAGRAHAVGRNANGANCAPRPSSAARTGRLRRRTAVQQEVSAAAGAADLAAGGPRGLGAATASPRSACARRCGDSCAASPRTRRAASRRGRSTSPSSTRVAHRVRDLVQLLHPQDRVLASLSVQLDLRCRSDPTFRRTAPCSRASSAAPGVGRASRRSRAPARRCTPSSRTRTG